MIKTSTRTSNSLLTEKVKGIDFAEDLNEDELNFYNFIKPDLNKIDLMPNPATITNLLNYSKSL
ncbi:MAG: hypothetical protein ABI390_01120 [Daejeonella sp.]